MLTLASPAKINLFLKVVGRRPDGYHELASLFQMIDLADTLHISLSDRDALTSTSHQIPTDGSNLILKAADLFRRKTKKQFGVHVHLVKRIPHQAGLGGGSSNAATTLSALNTLLGEPAGKQELMRWGAEIGSDVPFFFSGGTAYCTGRGEIVRELGPLNMREVWIVKPELGVSTPEVYRNLVVGSEHDPNKALEKAIAGKMELFNDLEIAAFKVAPALSEIKKKLGKGAMLSGSGSAFFCFKDPGPVIGADVFHSRFFTS